MEPKKRDRRDRLQNLFIVVLSLSFALLFVVTQSSTLGFVWNPNHFSDAAASTATPGESGTLAGLAAPIQVAVGRSNARFGQTYTTTANTDLSFLSTLMGSALGSSGERTACSDTVFQKALEGNSVCFDFSVSLPLSVLGALLSTDYPDTDFSARILVLAADESEKIQLYLRDQDGKSFSTTPRLNVSDLNSALDRCEPNGAAFAFELGEAYAVLDPYTLLAGEPLSCPALNASSSLSDKDTLLRLLGFNPHTTNRYTDAGNGMDTIVESTRSVRMRDDGTVLYSSDGDTSLTIAAAEQIPTLAEAAIGARKLAERLFTDRTGEAQLYLDQVTRTMEGIVVRFGLQWNGLPIRYADGAAAAEFTIVNTTITAFSLRLRQYNTSDQLSALLPLRQVVAVAPRGAKLTAAYVDDGSGTVSASWLAD